MCENLVVTGNIAIAPRLNESEVSYLARFSGTRRMCRKKGPYYTGSGLAGQDHEPDILDYNRPPDGQPGLWCHWVPTKDGSDIEWTCAEKIGAAAAWVGYLIDTFLGADATLKIELSRPIAGRIYPDDFDHFTFDHVLSGTINIQWVDSAFRASLIVEDNTVDWLQG